MHFGRLKSFQEIENNVTVSTASEEELLNELWTIYFALHFKFPRQEKLLSLTRR